MNPKLTVLFLFQSMLMLGQTELQNKKYNFDKNCGDGNQQTMNVCLSNAIAKLSKVMEKKYNCIVAYLDTEMKNPVNDPEIQTEYVKMKASLTASQATWKKLKDQNSAFYDTNGGTETPMLIGQSIVKDYKDRLAWLDNLIGQEGQGDVREILKCE